MSEVASPVDAPHEALVYCEGAFGNLNGKTAHGLVRFTRRYHVRGIVDSKLVGQDAGVVLDGQPRGIPIYGDLESALTANPGITHLVVGLAPDGGALATTDWTVLFAAVDRGLNVDSGLHTFLTDNAELAARARTRGVTLRDVRKPPPRDQLHFWTGKIEQVDSLKIAVLGADSAIGKRTTAWLLVNELVARGVNAELVGTGQTAWMQGACYSLILDSVVNDFLTGEIEHAVWSAWDERRPSVVVIEGQGALLHPAYPGGYEILGAVHPEMVLFQHAPTRRVYDGFPRYPIHPLEQHLEVARLLAGHPVTAICINSEGIADDHITAVCEEIEQQTGIPTLEPLRGGLERLAGIVLNALQARES
jgi:uncharacterized NAD-dependent epimerase/dehydratase family protein